MKIDAGVASIGGAAASIGAAFGGSKLAWSRQKRMMQKRHQWEVADLRAAGLNPILSAGGAPSMASPQAPQIPDLQKVGDQAIKSRQNKAERSRMKVQRRQMGVAMEQARSQIGLNTASALRQAADAGLSMAQTGLVNLQYPRAALDASIAGSASGQVAAQTGVWAPHVQAVAQILGALGIGRMAFRSAAPGAAKPTNRNIERNYRIDSSGQWEKR